MLKRQHHSHPKTYRFLNKISRINNVKSINLEINPLLYDLCSRLYVNLLPNKTKSHTPYLSFCSISPKSKFVLIMKLVNTAIKRPNK